MLLVYFFSLQGNDNTGDQFYNFLNFSNEFQNSFFYNLLFSYGLLIGDLFLQIFEIFIELMNNFKIFSNHTLKLVISSSLMKSSRPYIKITIF